MMMMNKRNDINLNQCIRMRVNHFYEEIKENKMKNILDTKCYLFHNYSLYTQ